MKKHHFKNILLTLLCTYIFNLNTVNGQSIIDDFNLTVKGRPSVNVMALQEDGKIIVGGQISMVGSEYVNKVTRLNADGSRDQTFKMSNIDTDYITKIVLDPDGNIIVFGQKDYVLSNDGLINEEFNFDNTVRFINDVIVLADAYIFSGFINDNIGHAIFKTNKTGQFDEEFGFKTADNTLNSITMLTSGKILVHGNNLSKYEENKLNEDVDETIFRINNDGSFDDTFTPVSGFNNAIIGIEIDINQNILVYGWFDDFKSNTVSNGLVRLKSDGAYDNTFSHSIINNIFNREVVKVQAIQDGYYLSGVNFDNSIGGLFMKVVKINNDGTIDNSYQITTYEADYNHFYTYFGIDESGDTYFSGPDVSLDGKNQYGLFKLSATGINDETFNAKLGNKPTIYNSIKQIDGRIIISGIFIEINGTPVENLARINADGSLDETFNLDINPHKFHMRALGLQDDGKIIVGGYLRTPEINYENLIRLNLDGTWDQSFTPRVDARFVPSSVEDLIVLNDDAIIIAGDFSNVGNMSRIGIAKVDVNGSVIPEFNSSNHISLDSRIKDIELQNDGKILYCGDENYTTGILSRIDETGETDDTFNSQYSLEQLLKKIAVRPDDSFVTGGNINSGTTSEPTPLLQFDLNGNLVDNTSIGIRLSPEVPYYSDLKFVSEDYLVVSGGFSSVSGVNNQNIAKISQSGQLYPGFDFAVDGYNISILDLDNNTIIALGSFSEVNNEIHHGAVKIKHSNDVPIVSGLINDLTINEDESVSLELTHLLVQDNDDTFPGSHTLAISDGNNYILDQNTIIPNENYFGTLSVPITVSDGKDESAEFIISIEVISVNDIPLISGQTSLNTDEEIAIEISLSDLNVTDPDHTFPDDFTFSLESGDNYSMDQHVITPNLDFNGTLNVPLTVNDGIDNSELFDLVIDVNPINDAPVILSQINELNITKNTVNGLIENSIEIALSDIEIIDVDNSVPDDITLSLIDGSDYELDGTTIISSGGFAGNLTIPVKVSDGFAESNTFDLTVIVNVITAINDERLNEISITPNPSSNNLNINISNSYSGNFSIQILDMSGKIKYNHILNKEHEVFKERIPITRLLSGIYLLKIIQYDRSIIKRFTKL